VATPSKPSKESPSSSGTGFFVAKGFVVTNAHVIKQCEKPTVKFPGDKSQKASMRAVDYPNDLALLYTEMDTFENAKFRFNLKLGEQVASFGFPFGDGIFSGGHFTIGNVTSLVGMNNNTSGFQISTPLQPGNSGSPLLDGAGRVLGMAEAVMSTLGVAETTGGTVPQNFNFGITAITIVGFLQANRIENTMPRTIAIEQNTRSEVGANPKNAVLTFWLVPA